MFCEITFGSEVGFRADDRGHLIEYIFHLSYQRELGAGTVEVVVRTGGVEVVVALQVVGEEPGAALQGHEPCTPGQALFLGQAHGSPGGGQIALGEHLS